MSSSKNLASMFAEAQRQEPPQKASSGSLADVYHAHHSTSKAVDAEDDSHFENTTFQLKRTRSMGLLDEFIVPTRKLIEEDEVSSPPAHPQPSQQQQQAPQPQPTLQQPQPQRTPHITQQPTSLELDFDDDDDGQFIENVDEQPSQRSKKNRNVIYTYDDDANDYDDDSLYDNTASTTNTRNQENKSPSPPSSPDLYQPHDDNDIVYEPSRHVDYLSHNWKEGDISKSWRYIVLKRKDVANSARLENASWRTWAQAKYHLKTISPESVNWLKDSDVTWLYGPIYKETNENMEDLDKKYGSDGESSTLNAIKRDQKKLPSTTPGSASSPSTKATRMGHFAKKAPKPILKKRTVSEMLTQPSMIKLAHHHHPHPLQSPPVTHTNAPSPPVFEDDFDMISKRVNAQYSKPSTATPEPSSIASVSSKEDPVKRHIHFSDRVEQCIALNYPDTEDEAEEVDDDDYEDDGDDEDNDDGVDSDESDDEGGFFLNVKSPSSAQLNRDFSLQLDHTPSANTADDENDGEEEDDDVESLKCKKMIKIIELLPATTLKYGSDEEEDEDEEKFAVSHRINTSRGYNYHYDYNSVFTGNQDSYVHLGNTDYHVEDTPQHLEGVDMVDVPENIVLGSNIEMMDTPEGLVSPVVEPQQVAQLPRVSSHTPQASSSHPTGLQRSGSSGAFSFHSDSESDSEGEQEPEGISSSPHSVSSIQKSINKVSSSPSYASLSDVAAQGYISQGSHPDVGQLQREFGNLSSGEEKQGFKAAGWMNSWKKN